MEDKTLKLIVQPRVIDHLGIKMYQKPVDVISEFVANAWDADSEKVEILLNADNIRIKDYGIGMTFSECQDFYLTVGRDRRKSTGKETSVEKERPVLGRKGIGKFAGFGIAKFISINSISKKTGEETSFEMNIDSILECDVRNEVTKPISVLNYIIPNEERKNDHGTTIILKGIEVGLPESEILKKELSRRFLLAQLYDDFKIYVNGEELPESFTDEMEFVFPKDITDREKDKFPSVELFNNDGWASEVFQNHLIKWRFGFYEDTIKAEELRGISIFAKGKLAQKPFFFDLSGGISGQNALEYMTGQVQMDFIDEGDNDLISTERQRINLQSELGKKIQEWGINKIKIFGSIWKDRRSEKKLNELNDKISGFRERLDNLPSTERKTVESVLRKIASFPRLGKTRYREWCEDILTSWEKGRLKNFIMEISEAEDLDETKLLEIFSESQVLTALNIAESIKTKIVTIGELKKRIETKELENKVRDYIYENPWLIHPKWESYRKERSVVGLIQDIANNELKVDVFNGRVDLVLSAGEDLLLIEFMRPGLAIDRDHLDRINYYVLGVRRELAKQTGLQFKRVDSAYVIADTHVKSEDVNERIQQLNEDKIYILTWKSLIGQALKQWEEHLDLLKSRYKDDIRIQAL